MIYIYGWVTNYVLFFGAEQTSRIGWKRLAAALSVLILGLIVVLRGRVGVDTTFVYESMAARVATGLDTEPLFAGTLFLLVMLFPTPLLAVTMGVGSLFVISLLVYVLRADSKELFILQGLFIPAWFWGSSISGQRYGLAFTLLLLTMQSLRLKQYKRAIVLSLVAIFTHYSCLIFLAFWAAMTLKVSRKNYFKFFGALAFVCLVVFPIAKSHIDEKFIVYFESDFSKPSDLSGLTDILCTGLLLLAVALGSLERTAKIRVVVVTLLVLIAGVAVSQYSYGGLRLVGIVEAAVPYAALNLYERGSIPFKTNFKSVVLAVGLFGALLTYRNMLNEDRVLDNPGRSLPYTFFWQE